MSELFDHVLSDEERSEGEFHSHYGTQKCSFQVDHKGRVFVSGTDGDGTEHDVILNEAVDADVVLRKIVALCLDALDHLTRK